MASINKSETIKARHIKRTMIQGGKEVPVEMSFTQKAWDSLGSVRIDGKMVPKQGFIRISDVQDPPEAKTSPGNQGLSQDKNPGTQQANTPDPVQTSPEASKQATQPNPSPPLTPTGLENVEQAIKAGEVDKLPMAILLNYVRTKNLAIQSPEKMPQHELLATIKSLLA